MFILNHKTTSFHLLLCVFLFASVNCNDCVLHIDDLNNCAKLTGIKRIPENTEGFGFGFGSVGDVEHMCRTRWHIKVYSCAQLTILGRCSRESTSHFRDVMWRFIFDTTPYEKAANYLCQQYNLRIFRYHRDKCLSKYESQVENCSKEYSNLLSRTHLQLAKSNPVNSSNADEYANYMKSVLSATYCSGTLAKVICIRNILTDRCSNDIIELVQNYFRETLPYGCEQTIKFNAHIKQNISDAKDTNDIIMNDFYMAYIKSESSEKMFENMIHVNTSNYRPRVISKNAKLGESTSKNSTTLFVQKVSLQEKNKGNKSFCEITFFLLFLTFIPHYGLEVWS